MKVSVQHRKRLVELAEKLFAAGINWIPMTPYRKPITHYKNRSIRYAQIYYKPMTLEQHEFFKEVCINTETCSGIAVVSQINGFLIVDFDPTKNPKYKLEPVIRELVSDYGHGVYFDRRFTDVNGKLVPKGLKFALFIDKNVLSGKVLRFTHNYEEEVSAEPCPPKTVFPSVRADGNHISAYMKLSHVDIYEVYYDKSLSVLKEVMEKLGVKMELADPISDSSRDSSRSDREEDKDRDSGTVPRRRIVDSGKIDRFDKMILLLKLVAEEFDCPGFKEVVEHLERGEWVVPYFIYRFGHTKGGIYQRSSYSIVENHIMEALAYLGVSKEVFRQEFLPKMEEAQRKLCQEYQHGCTHKTESRDISAAFKLKAFGHDTADSCIYKVVGLCPYEQCPYTFYGKLFSTDPNKLYLLLKQAEAGG